MKKKLLHIAVLSTGLLALVFVLGFLSNSTRSRQSYIVQGHNTAQVIDLVEAHHGIITSKLDAIQGVGALLPETAVARLRNHHAIIQIVPNIPVYTANQQVATGQNPNMPTADYSEVVEANEVWDLGYTGANVTIAILDSGLDANLPGINKDTNNNARNIYKVDFSPVPTNGIDLNGHGSHVAGIIANSRKGEDQNWNGIAPDVNLVNIRVLGEDGSGTYESVIQGIQWAIANKDVYDIRIMNLSLVAIPQSPYWADPLNQAVMEAWDAGIVVIAAAGNSGPEAMSITVPGNNPYVISVGAFTDNYTWDEWDDDYIPPFSAAGPTLDGFVKPDIIAPGAHMVSTMQSDTWLAVTHAAYKVGGTHFSMAGTSQATAVVSGIVALLLEQNPTLTPDQIKYRLMRTAYVWIDPETGDAPYSIWQQGTGRVNALNAAMTTTQEVANYGMDLQFDITNPITGYQGFSYYDADQDAFVLYDDDPTAWPGGFTTWSSSMTTWSGGFTTWSSSMTTWSGGFTTWSSSMTTWSGGFTSWAEGFTNWSQGNFGEQWEANGRSPALSIQDHNPLPWAGRYSQEWLESFAAGEPPPVTSPASIQQWVEEEDWANPKAFLPFISSN